MDPQIQVASILVILLGFLIWGRWRYDGVTLTALAVMVLLGLVPAKEAFLGFGHPAVITVALVLLISKALEKSGFINMIGDFFCLLYTSPSPRDATLSRMPSSA